MSDITKDQVVEWLSSQTVLEISEIVKELEEKWGVSAAAPVAPVAAPAAGGGDEGDAAAEEKDEFDIEIVGFDSSKKIAVIKEVRSILVWASRRPRIWWKARLPLSRKLLPRPMPRK